MGFLLNKGFSAFVFRTRGLYMFLALLVSMLLKLRFHGTTSLPFFLAGVIIAGAVQWFRIYSASYLWGRQAGADVEADFLCTSGPYAHLRNPLYLGNFLIGIGACAAIREWYAYVLFTASYALVYAFVIPYEEGFLEGKFGDACLKYKAHTRRLIPKREGYHGAMAVVPDFKAGVLGEIHVPIFLAVIFFFIYVIFLK